MFKGSENVGAGEHFFLVFNYGGSMNGTTSRERADLHRLEAGPTSCERT